MNIKNKIDEMNTEANVLASSEFEKSKKLSEEIVELSKKNKYVKGEANAYHNLGIAHYFNKENDIAYGFYEKALILLEGSEYLERQAAALHNIGLIDYDRCNFNKAVSTHKKALKLREKTGNQNLIALSLDYLGICYQALNDYENSLRFYLEAFKMKQKQKQPVLVDILRSYFNIGNVYYSQKKYENATEYFLGALSIAEETNAEIWFGFIYSSLGSCYNNLGNYNDALKMLNKSLDIFKKQNDLRGCSIALNSIASCFGFQNMFKESIKYHKEALEISRKLNLKREISISLRNIGMQQVMLKQYSEAELSYNEALKIVLEIEDKLLINEMYSELSKLYASQEIFDKAFKFQKKFIDLKEKIEDEKEQETIARLKVEFDLEKKEHEAEIHKLKSVTLAEANKKLAESEKNLKELTQTLEKRVQEELIKREAQQQQLIQKSKLESIGKLAAGIAHEINQPLGGISMGLENIYFAHSEGRLTEKYLDEKLKHIDGYFERIRQIIDHIRIFSRDQKSIIFESIDINETITNALSLLKTQFENHNVKLELDLNSGISKTNGNKYKLEQVILNLLTNAKDAVEEKQHTTNSSFHKRISIRTYEDSENITLEIEDNGIGIPEEIIGKVFDPFFTTKDSAKGTGLGLSIIYGIVKEMNGEISVESKLGEFTKMKVSFRK